MKHLSGVDASFLHLETPEMPMHVGSLFVLDLPKGYDGDFYEDVKRHVASRLHLAEVFERKLAPMPFELSNPVWVEDGDVDLDYHVRRVGLSKPGSFKQLEALIGRLHSSLLDRSRPLWEIYVIDGLSTGQPAIYSKVHHAAIDGQAGVALAKALYDISPEPRDIRPPRARMRNTQYQLGVAELASAAFQNTVQQYVKLVTTLPNMVRAVASVALPTPDKLALSMPSFSLPTGWSFAPKTPLNVSITNQRSFAARSVPLDEVKQVSKRLEVSLNDVVLAACATALKRYLADYNAEPGKPLMAGVPVSLREPGNTDPNNQVTMMVVGLATDVDDPIERLKTINASSSAAKELTGNFKAVIPTDFPSFGAPWIMSGLASLFGRSRISDQMPPVVNVAISNVPGVPVPLYVAGAKINTYFPVSIPTHGVALNITVQSYAGSLDYGLTACRRAVPDVDDLADYLIEAHNELKLRVLGPGASAIAASKKASAGAAAMVLAAATSPDPAVSERPRGKKASADKSKAKASAKRRTAKTVAATARSSRRRSAKIKSRAR
jgi:WS/DGAT/MGAT family acyltransferase